MGNNHARYVSENMNRKKPTAQQIADAAKLRAKWDARDRDAIPSQRVMADLLDMTQGAIWQTLNGRMPLSDVLLLRWASILKFDPRDIRPDITTRVPGVRPDQLGKDTLQRLASAIERLPPDQREWAVRMVESLPLPEPK